MKSGTHLYMIISWIFTASKNFEKRYDDPYSAEQMVERSIKFCTEILRFTPNSLTLWYRESKELWSSVTQVSLFRPLSEMYLKETQRKLCQEWDPKFPPRRQASWIYLLERIYDSTNSEHAYNSKNSQSGNGYRNVWRILRIRNSTHHAQKLPSFLKVLCNDVQPFKIDGIVDESD